MVTIHDTLAFADQLCIALDAYAYVVAGKMNPNCRHYVESVGCWAGNVPETLDSGAPHVAFAKMGEVLLMGGGLNGDLVLTPDRSNRRSMGFMGGAGKFGTLLGVSKWAQEHDQLLALILLYNAVHQRLTLHHAGFRFSTREDYDVANLAHETGIVVPAGDHVRTYFKNGNSYREHQYFPDGPHSLAKHWDFKCQTPKGLLYFIANSYGITPTFWDDAGRFDPVGVVEIKAPSGEILSVMARKRWWYVEDNN